MTIGTEIRPRSQIEVANALCGTLALTGIALALALGYALRLSPDSTSTLIFYRLFATYEPWGLSILIGFTAYVVIQHARGDGAVNEGPACANLGKPETFAVAACAAIVVAILSGVLFDGYPLSMDEYGAVFQARLFAAGDVAAPVPEEWRRHARDITPVFISVRTIDSAWVSPYLPGNALIRAPFEFVHLGWLSGALLAATSLVTIAEIGRIMWPGSRTQQRVALYALAASPQFLLTAATPYAMTAHLTVNLLWLLSWLRRGRLVLLCGPLGAVGVLLHQPVPHVLFAAPFLVMAVRDSRWKLLTWSGMWYISAILLAREWYDWTGFVAATGGLSAVIAAPHLISFVTLFMNALLLLAWQTPAVAIGLFTIGTSWRSHSRLTYELVAGPILALVFYLFFLYVSQGHGWGWRYGHQMLGNVALLAGISWPLLCNALGARVAKHLAVTSLTLTLLGQYPLRIAEARNLARPFARASSWIQSREADVVVVPTDSIWYGRDLIRNAAGLRRPIVISSDAALRMAPMLSPPMRVEHVKVGQLLDLGLERTPRR